MHLRLLGPGYRHFNPSVAMTCRFAAGLIAMAVLGYSLDNLSLMALDPGIGFMVDDDAMCF